MIGNHLPLRRREDGRTNPCHQREGDLPRAGIGALCLCLCFYSFCSAADASGAGPTHARVTPAQPVTPDSATLIRPMTRPMDPAHTSHPDPQSTGGLVPELWSSRIAAPAPNEDAETRLALRQLIRQVRSVKFDSGTSALPAESPVAPQAAPAPTKMEPAAGQEVAPVEPPVVSAKDENGSPLSPGAKKTLEGLLHDPRQAHDPLEVAELLFLSGRPADAVSFYEKALERTSAGDTTTAQDRAWILFQLANCLRETDLSQAQKTYMQLISEYPSSPWTELAKAQGQLVGWYQKDRPHQLIASRQP
jgi:hypothetical protein